VTLARTTERIELFVGRCRLRLRDRFVDLRCAIRVYQDYAGGSPTLKRAQGKFENLPQGTAAFAMMEGKALEVALEDGRNAAILLTDSQGNFTVSGPLA